jgi:phage tail-like protein
MTDIIGTPRELYHKYKFRVEIDGITYAGFSKCSELKIEIAKVEHWEGGSLTANKSPGRVTFPDITLEQGATSDLELYQWVEQVANVSAGVGGRGVSASKAKRNLEIIQLDREDNILQRWRVDGAWPSAAVVGEWDNSSDEAVITSLTLTHDGFRPMIRRAA